MWQTIFPEPSKGALGIFEYNPFKKVKIVAIALTSIKKFTILCYNTTYIYVLFVGGLRKWPICYKKLWKLLIDKDMKKSDLIVAAGISRYTINKLNRGENVTTDVLVKICRVLNCTMDDIMEILPDNE